MSESNDPVLAAIRTERKQLEQRLVVLLEMEQKLTGTAPRSLLRPEKAPAGELRKAQLAALRSAGDVTSSNLKKRVMDDGYPHHINGQYFTKTLRSLVSGKLVVKTENGAYSTYRLKR